MGGAPIFSHHWDIKRSHSFSFELGSDNLMNWANLGAGLWGRKLDEHFQLSCFTTIVLHPNMFFHFKCKVVYCSGNDGYCNKHVKHTITQHTFSRKYILQGCYKGAIICHMSYVSALRIVPLQRRWLREENSKCLSVWGQSTPTEHELVWSYSLYTL